MAEGIAALAVSKVAQKKRSRSGISSASVFQSVSRKPELKFIDVLNNAIAPAIGGALPAGTIVGLLNGCAQGTDAIQHIGRQTTMKSLYWLWTGEVQTTTVGGSSSRLVIVYDKEAEGAAPTIAAGVQTDVFNQDNILAQMNLNNRDRFVTLVDEIVEVYGSAGPQAFMRKGYRKVNLPCVFNASAAATVAAINTGSIYAFIWNGAGLGTAAPGQQLQTRVRFEDA